jgi:hypothetical protein
MKDAIAALSTHDNLVPALLPELTTPVLPATGLSPACLLLARQPVCRRQGEPQHGEQDAPRHRPRFVLGGCFRLHGC